MKLTTPEQLPHKPGDIIRVSSMDELEDISNHYNFEWLDVCVIKITEVMSND